MPPLSQSVMAQELKRHSFRPQLQIDDLREEEQLPKRGGLISKNKGRILADKAFQSSYLGKPHHMKNKRPQRYN